MNVIGRSSPAPFLGEIVCGGKIKMAEFCPSHAWDDYYSSQEEPEECPQCGAENTDEETGEWVYPAATGFCSQKCEQDHAADQAASPAAYADQWEQEKREPPRNSW